MLLFRPGPAPRALAYLGLSAYEASLGGMPEYQSLQFRLGISDMPAIKRNLYWPEVINASYGYLMTKFFEDVTFKDKNGNVLNKQEFLNLIVNKEKELRAKYRNTATEVLLNDSEAHGREVATAIWRFSISDPVGHNAHLNPFPVPVNAQGCEWVPTDPIKVADRGLFSQWGKVRRFAVTTGDLMHWFHHIHAIQIQILSFTPKHMKPTLSPILLARSLKGTWNIWLNFGAMIG